MQSELLSLRVGDYLFQVLPGTPAQKATKATWGPWDQRARRVQKVTKARLELLAQSLGAVFFKQLLDHTGTGNVASYGTERSLTG
jgi:hypothetical protein